VGFVTCPILCHRMSLTVRHFGWIRVFFRELSSSNSNWLTLSKHRVVEELITTYPAGISAENLVSVPQSSYVLPWILPPIHHSDTDRHQFSAAAVSGSFGGLLAAGISKMDGVGGKRGWAWIFVASPPSPPYLPSLTPLTDPRRSCDNPDRSNFLLGSGRLPGRRQFSLPRRPRQSPPSPP